MSARLELHRKSKATLTEAERDLKAGCYNKAVSAACFSLRLTAESTLDTKNQETTRQPTQPEGY